MVFGYAYRVSITTIFIYIKCINVEGLVYILFKFLTSGPGTDPYCIVWGPWGLAEALEKAETMRSGGSKRLVAKAKGLRLRFPEVNFEAAHKTVLGKPSSAPVQCLERGPAPHNFGAEDIATAAAVINWAPRVWLPRSLLLSLWYALTQILQDD